MENKTQEKQVFTNVNTKNANDVFGRSARGKEERVSITAREAMEYRDFKRQQKRAEILSAVARSEGVLSGNDDAGRTAEYAAKLRQAAVLLTPSRLEAVGKFFYRRGVATDCIVGGNGETLTKVKRYEARLAARLQAKELTLVLSPYQVTHCRYAEIRKEIKKISRVARKAKLKVWIDNVYPRTNISRMARLCAETGVAYFCVPYFDGCESLRGDLSRGCKLQVSNVQNLEQYRRLVAAGVGRIVTDRGWEIYGEWMREVDAIDFPQYVSAARAVEEPVDAVRTECGGDSAKPQTEMGEQRKEDVLLLPPAEAEQKTTVVSEKSGKDKTDCHCRMEETEIAFL